MLMFIIMIIKNGAIDDANDDIVMGIVFEFHNMV